MNVQLLRGPVTKWTTEYTFHNADDYCMSYGGGLEDVELAFAVNEAKILARKHGVRIEVRVRMYPKNGDNKIAVVSPDDLPLDGEG